MSHLKRFSKFIILYVSSGKLLDVEIRKYV